MYVGSIFSLYIFLQSGGWVSLLPCILLCPPFSSFLPPFFLLLFLPVFLLSTSASSSHCVEEAIYSFYRRILEGTNVSCILFLFETYLSWANRSMVSCCGFSDKNKPGWRQGVCLLLFNLYVFCLAMRTASPLFTGTL